MVGCLVGLPTIIGTIYLFAVLMGGKSEFFLNSMAWYIPLFIFLIVCHIRKKIEEDKARIWTANYYYEEIVKNFWNQSVKTSIEDSIAGGHDSETVKRIGEEIFHQIEQTTCNALHYTIKISHLHEYASHFGVLDWQEISNYADRIVAAHSQAIKLTPLLGSNKYGKLNNAFSTKLKDPSYLNSYTQIVNNAHNMMRRTAGLELLKADVDELDCALYYFATRSAQHSGIYERAKEAARFYLCFDSTSEVLLFADILAAASLGKEALRLKNSILRDWAKNTVPSSLENLASFLSAIGALEQELLVLSEYYSSGKQMSGFLQQRMAYLQTGALNAKSIYHEDAPSCTADTISIELESKGWNDRDLEAFFTQLQYAGRNKPQYALELRGKSTNIPISTNEDNAFRHIRLSLAAMVNEIKVKCGTDCKWLTIKPIDNNPPLKGFVIEKNGISYFMCMSKGNCQVILNQLAFCMPNNATDAKHIINLKQDSSIEQIFSDMRTAIQLYLQTEVHKVIYGGNSKKPDNNNSDSQYY